MFALLGMLQAGLQEELTRPSAGAAVPGGALCVILWFCAAWHGCLVWVMLVTTKCQGKGGMAMMGRSCTH
jgi:hypothetical protein